MKDADATARITSRADLEAALERLAQADRVLAPWIERLAPIPLRLRSPGFAGMAEIIVGQMVSKASAAAINARLAERLGSVSASNLLTIGEEGLDGVGLSRAKTKALFGLANAEADGRLDFESIARMDQETATKTLTALPGIGPWSAQVYLMFCAGHGDIFPVGDVALRQGLADLKLVNERPDQNEAEAIALRFVPHRSAAARVVWAVYAQHRGRGELPV